MKVIVSDTPLTVEDRDGNVLFQWFPRKELKFTTELKIKSSTDEHETFIREAILSAYK